MAKLHLLDEEKILATDDVRQFSLGIISYNAECTLTNKRLLLFPKGTMDKLTGERTELFLKSIKNIEGKGIPVVFHITSNSGIIRISGTGADRICDRLNRLLSKDKQVLSEKVLLQCDADVYLKGRLSTKGEIILSNKKLLVRSKGGLESLIFKGKELNTPLIEIRNINYEKIEQKLTITAKSGKITLGGRAANRLHATLLSLEGASADDLEEELKIYKALLYKGATRAANNGELSFTGERIIFTPSSTLDTMTGATLKYISLKKVSKLSKEKNLLIESAKHSLELMTSEKETIFSEIVKKLEKIKIPLFFNDIRDKKYSEERAKKQIDNLKLQFKFKDEIPWLLSWSVVQVNDDLVYPLWMFVSDQRTRFLNQEHKVVWEAPNTLVSIVENRSVRDHTIQLLFRKKRYKVTPAEGLAFTKFFNKKLKESRPSESEQFVKENQPIERITGSSSIVIFSKGGTRFGAIYNSTVKKQVRGLQISSEKVDSFPMKAGDTIGIELPKADGRFRFEAVISEAYMVEPDPVGRYYITVSHPQKISLYNDRASYRAPFPLKVETKIYTLPQYDIERDYVEEIPKEKYTLVKEELIDLEDLSVGGCGVYLNNSINQFSSEYHRVVIEFNLKLNKKNIPLTGVIRYQSKKVTDEANAIYRLGVEFFGMDNLNRAHINREVLKIEREQIRKELEKKELQEK